MTGRRVRAARRAFVLALVGACGGRAGPQAERAPERADLVLRDGKVFTSDPARPWTDAVAIRGDRIVAIGAEAARAPARRVVELGGRVVIPGINDAHTHEPTSWRPYEIPIPNDPRSDPSMAEVSAAIGKAAATLPAGTWISGPFSPAMIDDPGADRRALDRVAPDHPVWLGQWAGHAVLLNSAAIRRLGLDETAHRSGRLFEYDRWRLHARLADLADEQVAEAARAFASQAVRWGITTVQNMRIGSDLARLTRTLRRARLPIRWRNIRGPVDGVETGTVPPELADPRQRVYLSGIKYVLDGTPVERYAAMRQPYSDRPDTAGTINFSDRDIRRALEQSLRTGEQVQFHAVGDRAIEKLLSIMEATAPAERWRAVRVAIRHGDGFTPELVARASRLGVVVDQNPSHLGFPLLEARWGERARTLQPLRSMVDGGIRLALGSDGPVNPFLNIMLATTHRLRPDEALTREQAVAAYTRGSAILEGMEDRKGTIAPGMLADLSVLSADIFEIPASQLPRVVSLMTIVDGAIVHETRWR